MSRAEELRLEDALRATLHAAFGEAPDRIEWLSGALGLRRFARVFTGRVDPATLIARFDRPEDPAGRPEGIPPEPPLEPIRALLERAGLPVPRRLGGDPDAGLVLLEDVGERSLAEVARDASEADRRDLYREVCDFIPRLQRIADPGNVEAFARRLDAPYFRYKADLFCRHSLCEPGASPSTSVRSAVTEAFVAIGALVAEAPQRLAHRDLQSQNLILRPAAEGPRLAWIDLQGALLAAPEYDLVCLLRDSYVELQAETIGSLFEHTRAQLPDAPPPDLARLRFDALTLTRKGKDHARFLYAARDRGDDRYLTHLPTTVRHLHAAAGRLARAEPRFAELAEIVHTLPESPCGP